jgi:hypothetical protein
LVSFRTPKLMLDCVLMFNNFRQPPILPILCYRTVIFRRTGWIVSRSYCLLSGEKLAFC